MRALVFVLLLPVFASAQDIHVTASPLLPSTVKAMFGRNLPKGYSAVTVDICSGSQQSITVPLGLIRQKYRAQFPTGPTILSNAVASQVIQSAQGSSKSAVVSRIVLAAAGSAAVAVGFAGITTIWKTGLTDFTVDGPLLWSMFSAVAQPAALIGYSQQALPETIQIAPESCAASSTQLVEGAVKAVEFDVTLPAEKPVAPTGGGFFITPTPSESLPSEPSGQVPIRTM
jgi:hypothetical protein